MKNEYIKYGGGKKCEELMSKYPDYKVFWQSGWGWKGASDMPLDKESPSFKKNMENKYKWAANISITVNHDKKELHFNGLSVSDME